MEEIKYLEIKSLVIYFIRLFKYIMINSQVLKSTQVSLTENAYTLVMSNLVLVVFIALYTYIFYIELTY